MMVIMMTIFRHANLVLHVRMKGALLGSVDLALQVLISISIILSRFAGGKLSTIFTNINIQIATMLAFWREFGGKL